MMKKFKYELIISRQQQQLYSAYYESRTRSRIAFTAAVVRGFDFENDRPDAGRRPAAVRNPVPTYILQVITLLCRLRVAVYENLHDITIIIICILL